MVTISLRAKISEEVNKRFMDDLSMLSDESPTRDFIDEITGHRIKNGRRFRALDPTGKDRALLQAISNPEFRIGGLTNKMLRQHLSGIDFGTDKQLSAKISRQLRLLRAHGII